MCINITEFYVCIIFFIWIGNQKLKLIIYFIFLHVYKLEWPLKWLLKKKIPGIYFLHENFVILDGGSEWEQT